ncbi:MAG: SPOR domain-containing protein [Gammaproteobacteria bacterium]|nr:SPOR domain-containing protein [Gammaproteobacteria bacterium]
MKQRLIGAVVLLGAAVVIVPIILPGPSSEGVVIRTNALAPAQPTPNYAAEAAPRERPNAIPSPLPMPVLESAPETSPPETKRAPAQPPSAGQPRTKAPALQAKSPAQPSASVGDGWAIQVGSFSSAENALRLRDRMRGQGLPAFVRTVQRASGQMTRVLVGPVDSKVQATELAGDLRKKRLPTTVVRYP